MWSFSKRLAALCCASLAASAALLSADIIDGNYDNGDNFYGNAYYDGSFGECCDSQWSLEAQFLYWKAHVDSLPISRLTSTFTDKTEVKDNDGCHYDAIVSERVGFDTRYPHFKWRPGVRLVLGYKNPECVWDANASWTYLYSHAHGDQHQGTPGSNEEVVLESAWPSGLSDPVSIGNGSHKHEIKIVDARARGRWSLNYNVFELSFGHTYTACDCFSLRPHADLKVAWIDQRFSSYLARDISVKLHHKEIDGTFYAGTHAKRRFTGVGPQVGLGLSWDLGCGWNVFADAYGALLYARPKVSWSAHSDADINHEQLQETVGSGGCNKRRNHERSLFYNTGIAVGFGWNTWLCDNSYLVSLKLAWEEHIYFNQNNFHRGFSVQGSEEKGELSLYGLTVAVGLDF